MANKALNEKKSLQLGMPIGTATAKLRLKVIFDLLKTYKHNICSKCQGEIFCSEDLSLTHLEHWLDRDPNLFWSSNNITFTHRDCDAAKLGKNKMIEVKLVNEQGETLQTYQHQNKTYVLCERNTRYNIRIKNTTSSRLEVVVSVDGRDVISGKEADYQSQVGYVINPYQEFDIKGFRQTNDTVAAFKFCEKSASYSDLMGTPQNVGVVGVAVFQEKQIPLFTSITYKPYNDYLSPWRERNINHPFGQFADWNDDFNYQYIPTTIIGCGGGKTSAISSQTVYGTSVSTSMTTKRMVKTADLGVQNTGTEYGETIDSKIVNTTFTRTDKNNPSHLVSLYYDDFAGLKAKGVLPVKPMPQEPIAFPAIKVDAGFAPPPPQKKNIRKGVKKNGWTSENIKNVVNELDKKRRR